MSRVAIDAMGGDLGPQITVPGAIQLLRQHPEASVILVGNQPRIEQQISKYSAAKSSSNFLNRLSIIHTDQVVTMNDKPSTAVRHKLASSLGKTIELVKQGAADSALSAGNTGAMMALGRRLLGTFEGIDRPAIVSNIPSAEASKGSSFLLDVGANVDCQPRHLLQFAMMGSVLAKSLSTLQTPRVALLNVGEEIIKGNDLVRLADDLLSQTENINYIGYVEADQLFQGVADVVVCDGFVGNAVIKASEGTAKLIRQRGRVFIQSHWSHRMLAALVQTPLRRLVNSLDPSRYNGASFLGLKGALVKSHGSADQQGFFHAAELALEQGKSQLPNKIRDGLMASMATD